MLLQAELDRQEEARAEAERERMRRLMREGIISFEQLQEENGHRKHKDNRPHTAHPTNNTSKKKKRVSLLGFTRDIKALSILVNLTLKLNN